MIYLKNCSFGIKQQSLTQFNFWRKQECPVVSNTNCHGRELILQTVLMVHSFERGNVSTCCHWNDDKTLQYEVHCMQF
jgi:hypothetical protein